MAWRFAVELPNCIQLDEAAAHRCRGNAVAELGEIRQGDGCTQALAGDLRQRSRVGLAMTTWKMTKSIWKERKEC